jgi:AcrR family transcriptional regulator
MGLKERHERERETVRRTILDAARQLFVEQGYAHVSMRKIAERIEYSPGAIYGYFPGKDDIFLALAEEGFKLLHDMAQEVPEREDALATLRDRMFALYEFSKLHPEYFSLMFMERSVPRIGEHYQRFGLLAEMKRRIATYVERCVERGALPPSLDAMAAVRVCAVCMIGAAGTRLCNRLAPGEDPDALARDVLDLALAGLRSGVSLTFVDRGFGSPRPAEDDSEASELPVEIPNPS